MGTLLSNHQQFRLSIEKKRKELYPVITWRYRRQGANVRLVRDRLDTSSTSSSESDDTDDSELKDKSDLQGHVQPRKFSRALREGASLYTG